MDANLQSLLDAIDTINDARSLAKFERDVEDKRSADPFFLDDPDMASIRHRIAAREALLAGSDGAANDFGRGERLRAMADALQSVSTKGSGVRISQRVKNGRRVPLSSGGFDVPASGSGDSAGNDPWRAALGDFLETYVRPNLSEGYVTGAKSGGAGARLIGGNELLDKEGVVPGDAATAALNGLLYDLAESGAMGPEELDAFAAENNLSKSALSKARGAAKRRTQANPEAKARRDASKKVVGAAIKAARQSVEKALNPQALSPEKQARLEELRAKRAAASGGDDPEDAGSGDGEYSDYAHKMRARLDKQSDAEWKKKAKEDEAGESKGKGGPFDLYKGMMLMGAMATSVRAGLQMGNAAGAVAGGLAQAVTGAAGAFVQAGQAALGLFLSPFGQSGQAVSRIAGGLAGALQSVLTAGGGLAAAGVKVGVGLAGAVVMGAGAALGAGLGALLGSVIPGAGTLAGAVAGAGLFAAIGSAMAGLMTTLGGAVGQALGAIGTAFSELGRGIGEVLGNIKAVLSDLIATGTKFADATLTLGRTGNLSPTAGAGVASLARMLTGQPGGLNGVYGDFGTMSQFMGSRLRAFGVAGATGTDPLGDMVKSANAYAGMDPVRRQLLVQGGFGGNAAVGNLFALNAYAPGTAAMMAGAARRAAMSPGEVVADARLGANLSVIDGQMDRLKTRLLTDIMPLLTMGLAAFGKWFQGGGSGKIVAGLESAGRWLYVELPELFRRAGNGFFAFADALGQTLVTAASLGAGIYTVFATLFNGISTGLGGLMALLGANLSLIPGLGKTGGDLYRAGGAILNNRMDPNGPTVGGVNVFQALGAQGATLSQWTVGAKKGFDQWFQENAGDLKGRSAGFDHYMTANQPQQITVNYRGEHKINVEIDLDKLRQSTTAHIARELVMAEMRAGS